MVGEPTKGRRFRFHFHLAARQGIQSRRLIRRFVGAGPVRRKWRPESPPSRGRDTFRSFRGRGAPAAAVDDKWTKNQVDLIHLAHIGRPAAAMATASRQPEAARAAWHLARCTQHLGRGPPAERPPGSYAAHLNVKR